MKNTFEWALFQETAWFLVGKAIRPSIVVKAVKPTVPVDEMLIESKRLQKPVVEENSSYKCLILFVSDFPRGQEGALFNEEQKQLLAKIAQAMKLKVEHYQVCTIYSSEEDLSSAKKLLDLERRILSYAPRMIISLGAGATHALLEAKERLSMIHGKIFDREFCWANKKLQCKIMPLFHLDFMLMNPNMKRAAWTDLQKVMELLQIS